MRVIKRLRKETPSEQIARFFSEMGIVTKVILALLTVISLVLAFTLSPSIYSLAGIFSMRITEILLFVMVGVSDLKREEAKGSFFLILTFLFKSTMIILTHLIISNLVGGWPEFDVFSHTSIPIQYLFVLMVEGAFEDPQNLKYLFIEPFQLKSKFYPMFFFGILMIASIRVDLVVPFLLSLIFHFGKVNVVSIWATKALNQRLLTQRMVGLGFIKQLGEGKRSRQMDELATNDSICCEQK